VLTWIEVALYTRPGLTTLAISAVNAAPALLAAFNIQRMVGSDEEQNPAAGKQVLADVDDMEAGRFVAVYQEGKTISK
jgi:hypothetical protein